MDARALPPPFAPAFPRPRFDGASSLPPQYEFLRVLGCGGMGTTVLARERSLGRLIAVKRVRESSPLFLERFGREARIMGRLVHPGIVPIYAFGRWRDQPYFAMRYVGGGSLALARQAPRALIGALRPVVDALALAHENGIVHRDVKPENILLDERGRAYLTDFGPALDAREEIGGCAARPIAGTPLTMSPEQVLGEHVGPASDVFSLGVTLYRQLTGEWPFRGRTVVDVLRAIREQSPAKPRDVAPDLPRALDALLLRCLAKDPSARYLSMAELALAFDRFLEGRTWFGLALPARASARRARRGGGGRSIHPEELS